MFDLFVPRHIQNAPVSEGRRAGAEVEDLEVEVEGGVVGPGLTPN